MSSSLDIPSDDSETLDIAQSMGFSSFGTTKTNKKRRFNPKTDAAVDTTTGDIIAGSGGNSIPLGRRNTRGSNSGEEVKEVGGGMDGKGEMGKILGDGDEGGEEEDPGYVEGSSEGEGEREGKDAQTQVSIKAVKPGGGGGVHITQSRAGQYQFPYLNTQSSTSTATSLPPKPLFQLIPSIQPSATTQPAQSTQPITQSATPIRTDTVMSRDSMSRDEAQQLRRGIRDSMGDIAYYDPSFVEDPWAKLVV